MKKIKFKVPYFESFLFYEGTIISETNSYYFVKYRTGEDTEKTTQIPKNWVI